jgi:hypothetical protein
VSRCKWPPCELMRSRPCGDGWFAAHAGKSSGSMRSVRTPAGRRVPERYDGNHDTFKHRAHAGQAQCPEPFASHDRRRHGGNDRQPFGTCLLPAGGLGVAPRPLTFPRYSFARRLDPVRNPVVLPLRDLVVGLFEQGRLELRPDELSDRNAAGDWPEREIGESSLSLQVPAAKGK